MEVLLFIDYYFTGHLRTIGLNELKRNTFTLCSHHLSCCLSYFCLYMSETLKTRGSAQSYPDGVLDLIPYAEDSNKKCKFMEQLSVTSL